MQHRNKLKYTALEGNLGTWDYIIVGAGTAGCVLANRLSANPDVKVLLLEAGGKDNWMWIHIPCGYLYCIGNSRTDWCYKTESDPGLNDRSILYARGRVLGGCSSINAMLYVRGNQQDYNNWAQMVNDSSWSWEKVLPFFKRSENYYLGADDVHGATGELRVEKQRLSWKILDAFRDAMAQVGIAKINDFNRGDNEGSAFFDVNQRRGFRWSASKAFLRPVMRRANLTVITEALVERIRFDGKCALGIEFLLASKKLFAKARIETILAAGAIGSPQILQLSGIGSKGLLQRYNIPVIHELIGVGENLQDHLQLRMGFKVNDVITLNQRMNNIWQKILMGLEYIFFRTGPLTMAPSQLGAFTKSDSSQAIPNLEYHIQPLSLDKFGDKLHTFPAFTASIANIHPTSRGFVRIKSASPYEHPNIQLNYLSTEEDKKTAVNALRLTRKIVAQSALAKYQPQEFKPGIEFQTDEELVKAAGDIGTTIFHPVGTCKMGLASDPSAVVDTRLRVHGVERLRVVDASIMPIITSGNTNAPTLMIAEKAADMIQEDHRINWG